MAFIRSSSTLYAAPAPGAAFDIVLELDGDFAGEAFAPNVDDTLNLNFTLAGEFSGEAFNPFADDSFAGNLRLAGDFISEAQTSGDDTFHAVLDLDGDFLGDTELVLQNPSPITATVAAGAFENQDYKVAPKLFINNVAVPYLSAEINAPAGSLGKSLSIQLASADIAQLPAGATFRFEIYKRIAGNLETFIILDGGKLAGRSFQMSVGRNSLSFSTFETDSKLNKYPRNNLIVFDAAKTNVTADEIEALPTNTGEAITTTARGVSVLTLWKLLDIAFVEGCGFSSVETNIPNYPIARCDFSVVNSYHDAVKQFIGSYEPVMKISGNALTIQKTIDPLPVGYEPNRITANRYPSFTETLQNADSKLDGYILYYTATAGSRFADRNLPARVIPGGGQFGDEDYTETTVERRVRDWFETGNAVAVRTEDKQEIRTTRRSGVIIGRETTVKNFDRLGRAAGYTNVIEARMPDIANNNLPALLKTKESGQKIDFTTNPFSPRQTIPSKIENFSRALLAIDSENTALDKNGEDAPYAQDYEKVFDAGNLKTEMTAAFQTLERTTEYYRPLSNGQIEVRVETYDALRDKIKNPTVEYRTGDISIPNFSKQKTKTIFRVGVNQANRTGYLQPLNVGELPLFFAEDLADWLLENPRVIGNIELAGFDESIERGVSFNLRGPQDEDLGNFLTRGYVVVIKPVSITTTIEALKI